MRARIKTKNGFYDAEVFAVHKTEEEREFLVMDEANEKLIRVTVFETINRAILHKVFIYDVSNENWIERDEDRGYDWILNAEPLESVLPRCKEMQLKVKFQEWFEIKSQKDIDGVMEALLWFHDTLVIDKYKKGNKQYIKFVCWGGEALFECDGDVETNVIKGNGTSIDPDDDPNWIFEASMFIENGRIFWAAWEGIEHDSDIDKEHCPYFAAQHVRWSFEIK